MNIFGSGIGESRVHITTIISFSIDKHFMLGVGTFYLLLALQNLNNIFTKKQVKRNEEENLASVNSSEMYLNEVMRKCARLENVVKSMEQIWSKIQQKNQEIIKSEKYCNCSSKYIFSNKVLKEMKLKMQTSTKTDHDYLDDSAALFLREDLPRRITLGSAATTPFTFSPSADRLLGSIFKLGGEAEETLVSFVESEESDLEDFGLEEGMLLVEEEDLIASA